MDTITLTLKSRYTSASGIRQMMQDTSFESTPKYIQIDIRDLKFIEIGPLALLLAFILKWRDAGISIKITYNRTTISYLQRIDFFRCAGVTLEETFARKDARSRFVEFKPIDQQSADVLSDSVASCIAGTESDDNFEFTDAPGQEGYYEAIAYSVSELIKNVQQHSMGSGYVVAQHYPSARVTQVAIFDTGIGVRESFSRNSSPYAASMSSDLEALKVAIKAEVSSKTHLRSGFDYGNENAGVGLTLLTEIAITSGGTYQIVSGNAILTNDLGEETNNFFRGTLVCLTFDTAALNDFGNLLENAKRVYLDPPGSELDDELNNLFR